MSNSNKIASLETLSRDLLDKTLAEIKLHRKQISQPKEGYCCTAEYLLQEAMEYVAGAWEMIKSRKTNASIALSRWTLEASLNLLWTVADQDKINERLNIICGEALRNEANLLEGLAELWPAHAKAFKSKVEEARRVKKSLGVCRPETLDKRLKNIEQEGNLKCPKLYPLYRICCSAAHPSLNVWERFNLADGTIVSQEPIDKQSLACWMAASSTFYLVICTYRLAGLGDSEQLKDWWENKTRPLLNED